MKKSVISLLLVVSLVVTMFANINLSVFATTDIDLTIPSDLTAREKAKDMNTFWTDAGVQVSYSAIDGATWTGQNSGGPWRMEGYTKSYPLDGYTLNFSNISATNRRAVPMFILSDTLPATGESFTLASTEGVYGVFVLATDEGKLLFNNKKQINEYGNLVTKQVLLEGEALKYDSIAGKQVSITFRKGDNGAYTVEVLVGDTLLTGENVLTKDMLDSCSQLQNLEHIYCAIGCGYEAAQHNGYTGYGSTTFTLNSFGTLNRPSANQVVSEIQNLGTISLADGNKIRAARKLYNYLYPSEKAKVTNYDVLCQAETAYRRLEEVEDKALTLMQVEYGRLYSHLNYENASTLYYEHASMINLTNVKTGGIRYNFSSANTLVSEGIDDALDLDHLYLQFDSLNTIDPAKCYFTVKIGNVTDNILNPEYQATGDSCLALMLDVIEGTITAYPKNEIVIRDDCLKYNAIKNRRFSYHFIENSASGYDLSVRVGEHSVSGSISSDALRVASQLTDTHNCSVAISNITDGYTAVYTVDLIGYRSTADDAKAEAVIAQIAALPDTLAEQDLSAFDKVLEDYSALTRQLKSLVTNYEKLASLVQQSYELRKDSYPSDITGDRAAVVGAAEKMPDFIDNSTLIPAIQDESAVTVDANGTPDWVSDLIMMQVNIRTATKEGTLEAAVSVLEHCAEMGVNGIWLCPVYDRGTTGNGYTNLGPDTICPYITGQITYGEAYDESKIDYVAGWQALREFVATAHEKNIRVFLDVVSWGTLKESKHYQNTNTRSWYQNRTAYGGQLFDWTNGEFKEWYINQLVTNVKKAGFDGYRFDCEPQFCPDGVVKEVKNRLATMESPRKVFLFSEAVSERSLGFDTEQGSVKEMVSTENYYSHTPTYYMLDKYNMVDSIKKGQNIGTEKGAGTYRYYTYCLSNHDNRNPVVQGNRLAIGYQAIYSPFLPLWYMGEEWNNVKAEGRGTGILYANPIDWNALDDVDNKEFYEDVKAMIRVRRTYRDIFSYYPTQFKDTNICKVDVSGAFDVQAYARYAGDTAILILPNYNVHEPEAETVVYMPFTDTGLAGYKYYTVSDAVTGEVVANGTASDVAKIRVDIPYADQRVLVVKGHNVSVADTMGTWSVEPRVGSAITLRYKVQLSNGQSTISTPKMRFHMEGVEDIEVVGTVQRDGRYCFDYEILPQQMADAITAELVLKTSEGNEQRGSKTYSMVQYCRLVLDDVNSCEELKALLVDLMGYGAESQEKMGERPTITADLTEAEYELGSKVVLTELTTSPKGYVVSPISDITLNETTAYQWKSASLILDSRVTIRFKFTATDVKGLIIKAKIGDDQDISFSGEGQIMSAGDGSYYIDVPIYANEYGKQVVVKFDQENTATLSYSVNTYLYNKRATTGWSSLLTSIYRYGLSAVAYDQRSSGLGPDQPIAPPIDEF